MDQDILMYQECIRSTISALAEEVRSAVGAFSQKPLITFRVKDSETLKKKMQLKGVQSIFSIDDVYGIRIIVQSLEEVYVVLERLQRVFRGYIDHDYFKNHKPSPVIDGKMLRLLQFIAYKNSVPFEIQITTVSSNEVNETLHEGYHSKKYNPQNL